MDQLARELSEVESKSNVEKEEVEAPDCACDKPTPEPLIEEVVVSISWWKWSSLLFGLVQSVQCLCCGYRRTPAPVTLGAR